MTNTEQLIQEMASDMNFASVEHDLWPDDAKEIAKVLVILGYRKNPEVVYENKRIYLNNKLIGYIDFSFYEDIKALGIGDFEIIDRRKGYGFFVVKDIIAKYKNKYDLIYCFVDKDNIGAIEFYKKVGKVCFDKINDKNQYYVILYENEIKQAREQMAKKCIGRMIKLMHETGDFNLYNQIIDFAKELQLLEENE